MAAFSLPRFVKLPRPIATAGALLLVPAALKGSADDAQNGQVIHSAPIAIAPGESLHVTLEGTGEPVVLIPGLVGSAFGYRLLRAELVAAGFQAVVIEPLGIGDSPRPERANYSLTAQADRIAATMERLHLENAIMVAHAVGASMALRMSYRFPGRIRALVSLDGGPAERAATPGFRRAMRFAPFVKMFGGVKLVRKKLREQLISQSGDTSWVTDAVVDGYTAGHARDLDGTLKAYLRMADAREAEALAPNLARVGIPVRLLIGLVEHSGVPSREEIQLLTTRLPDFSVKGIAGAGHFLHEERPDIILAAVVALTQSRPRLVRGDE
jgi:pimeloyl-ACP methyl ester carboxylesterase